MFIAHLKEWKGGEVLLLVTDQEGVRWLASQFERLASASLQSVPPQFVLGDGNPVESDGRCLVLVELSAESNGSRIVRADPSGWRWSVSRPAANNFQNLLSGMLAEHGCHQYLDADNDDAPKFEVSLGEYEIDLVREWAAQS